jgi:hypothetical protein
MKINARLLSDPADRAWYGVQVLLSAPDHVHFPTRNICGVREGRFTDTNGVGYKLRGVMGSSTVGVSAEGAEKAADLLRAAGHSVVRECFACAGSGSIVNSYDERICDLCHGAREIEFFGFNDAEKSSLS